MGEGGTNTTEKVRYKGWEKKARRGCTFRLPVDAATEQVTISSISKTRIKYSNDVWKEIKVGSKILRYARGHETGSLILRTPGLFGSTSVSILHLYFLSVLFQTVMHE